MKRVAVVGATGAVGQAMLEVLRRRQFPVKELGLFASARSAGQVVSGIEIKELTDQSIQGYDIALFSAGSQVSREWAPRFVETGAVVIDNSGCWRQDDEVPLVVSEINAQAAEDRPKGIIANPNCVAITCLLSLAPLDQAFGLLEFTSTSFQAAGGAGEKGMQELEAQVPDMHAQRHLLRGKEARQVTKDVNSPVHHKPLAYNVVPLLGTLDESGYTDEELKMIHESRKILALPELQANPTCVRVPTLIGHAIQIHARFKDHVSVKQATRVLERAPGLVLDAAPTPLEYAGHDEVAVGRIRQDLADSRALNWFTVGDNLLKGAALNAVQIAELIS